MGLYCPTCRRLQCIQQAAAAVRRKSIQLLFSLLDQGTVQINTNKYNCPYAMRGGEGGRLHINENIEIDRANARLSGLSIGV